MLTLELEVDGHSKIVEQFFLVFRLFTRTLSTSTSNTGWWSRAVCTRMPSWHVTHATSTRQSSWDDCKILVIFNRLVFSKLDNGRVIARWTNSLIFFCICSLVELIFIVITACWTWFLFSCHLAVVSHCLTAKSTSRLQAIRSTSRSATSKPRTLANWYASRESSPAPLRSSRWCRSPRIHATSVALKPTSRCVTISFLFGP